MFWTETFLSISHRYVSLYAGWITIFFIATVLGACLHVTKLHKPLYYYSKTVSKIGCTATPKYFCCQPGHYNYKEPSIIEANRIFWYRKKQWIYQYYASVFSVTLMLTWWYHTTKTRLESRVLIYNCHQTRDSNFPSGLTKKRNLPSYMSDLICSLILGVINW